jgi:hypothetical protein
VNRWALVLLLVLPLGDAVAQSKPRLAAPNLFAFPAAVLDGNRVACGVDNIGQVCRSFAGSPIAGGAFWPKGTADQYIFNSGLQVAALIPAGAGFAWAGDTVGAFFMDPRGDQTAGTPRTNVFNSRDTTDAADWPIGAVVRDTALFHPGLIGRDAAADHDLWTRYWDGNPASLGGRPHQMGIAVDQRLLAWNYPTGNEDVIYIVYTIYNVSARTPAVYANATIPVDVQPEIAALGARFQDSVEAALAVTIPDGGYVLDSMYVALYTDHDIATFSDNHATVSVPFGLGIGYAGSFVDGIGWTYPLEIFGSPPFVPAPGLLGTAFLRSPAPFQWFTISGPAVFPDPVGVSLLWRRLSGHLRASDIQCNPFTDAAVARARHVCYHTQVPGERRFLISTGPFRLAPGEATTIVIPYVFAAPLDTVSPYIGGGLPPGLPFPGDSIALDTTKIRAIERAAGWVTQSDANANGIIEGAEVITARRSLLFKTQVAQALVDAKFLLPSAPEPPEFFLIPGDNAVTVVWRSSASETTGDPYFALASDRASALYDPNYRQFDVEGYRIYRGRDPRALELIAQVDHDTTSFIDYLGAVQYVGQCAPEFGLIRDCPVDFPPLLDTTISARVQIAGRVAQVPEGYRIVTTNGALTTLRADTFPTGAASGFPLLDDAGVKFAYTDSGALNSFRYYYAVTAFDFNSIRSGPVSFESPRLVKTVTPRVPSGQETAGSPPVMRLLGADGTQLSASAPVPSIDATTGIFSGAMPPTNGFQVALAAFLPQLLTGGTITVTIDSVRLGVAAIDVLIGAPRPALYYVSATMGADTSRFVVPLTMDGFEHDRNATVRFAAVPVDSAQAVRFGGDSTFSLFGDITLSTAGVWRLASWGRGNAFAQPSNSAFNGPRWWTGAANENTPNPNGGNCSSPFTVSACGNTTRVPDIGRTAGSLPGVTIFHPQSYSSIPNAPGRTIEGALATVVRAADFRIVWGAGGGIASVFDVTHQVPVPFSPRVGPGWGILTHESFAAVTEGLTGDGRNFLLTWSDVFCADPLPEYLALAPTTSCGGDGQTPAALRDTATLTAIAIRDTASSYTGTAAASYTATGNGFIFYLNGHFFLMQMAALPASGTAWNARFYSGTITGTAAGANFAFLPATRPPAVPGLRAELAFEGTQLNRFATTDSLLARVHTVPDPFYARSGYELAPDTLALKFVHLPARAIIRIYSLSGILVAVLFNDDPTGGGEVTWDLNSRSGKRIASGVYFYHVETPDRRSRVGRFTVITGPRSGP